MNGKEKLVNEIEEVVQIEKREIVLDNLQEGIKNMSNEITLNENDIEIEADFTAEFMQGKNDEIKRGVKMELEANKEKLSNLTPEERKAQIRKITIETCEKLTSNLENEVRQYVRDNWDELITEAKRRREALRDDNKFIAQDVEPSNNIIDVDNSEDLYSFEVYSDNGKKIWKEDKAPKMRLEYDTEYFCVVESETCKDLEIRAKDYSKLAVDVKNAKLTNWVYPTKEQLCENIFEQSFITGDVYRNREYAKQAEEMRIYEEKQEKAMREAEKVNEPSIKAMSMSKVYSDEAIFMVEGGLVSNLEDAQKLVDGDSDTLDKIAKEIDEPVLAERKADMGTIEKLPNGNILQTLGNLKIEMEDVEGRKPIISVNGYKCTKEEQEKLSYGLIDPSVVASRGIGQDKMRKENLNTTINLMDMM